jgi:hypothetical protein
MAKKIQLHKQTLRVLSAEEMEAVAGGADTSQALPASQSCISVVNCFDGSTTQSSALPASQSCISVVNCYDGGGDA